MGVEGGVGVEGWVGEGVGGSGKGRETERG